MRSYNFKLSILKRIYYNRHKKLWNEIVKKLVNPKFDPSSISIEALKMNIYNKLWPGSNITSCIACLYKIKKEGQHSIISCKDGCLLKTSNINGFINTCLDGKYYYFINAYYGGRAEAIEWAKAIRDLPINPLS